MSNSDLLKSVSNEFSRVFRHIFPGFIVLSFMYCSHPSWFVSADISKWTCLMMLVVVALIIGNIWYVIHRYTIHNFLDLLVYFILHKKITGYIDWVSSHIISSFSIPSDKEKLQKHIHFRSAQIIFIFIIAEALLMFGKWYEPKSLFQDHGQKVFFAGCLLFVIALIQFAISYFVDIAAVKKYAKD